MSAVSPIEWTDATWNPVTGCTEVSPGCDHCYARVFAERWRGIPGHVYTQGFDLRLWEERVELPLTWKKPRRIFVNSMSDLFHAEVPTDFIQRVFDVMNRAHWHTFQVLTKRPQRMARLASTLEWGEHIWQGVTIEHRDYVWRADYLRQVHAAIRFISAEPLLSGLETLDLAGIHWLITGGESGHGARPAHLKWIVNLRDRCLAQGVAYFHKQWGAWVPQSQASVAEVARRRRKSTLHAWENGEVSWRVGKTRAGRALEGRTWDQYPVPVQVTERAG